MNQAGDIYKHLELTALLTGGYVKNKLLALKYVTDAFDTPMSVTDSENLCVSGNKAYWEAARSGKLTCMESSSINIGQWQVNGFMPKQRPLLHLVT